LAEACMLGLSLVLRVYLAGTGFLGDDQ